MKREELCKLARRPKEKQAQLNAQQYGMRMKHMSIQSCWHLVTAIATNNIKIHFFILQKKIKTYIFKVQPNISILFYFDYNKKYF